jgi:hypothetical protein
VVDEPIRAQPRTLRFNSDSTFRTDQSRDVRLELLSSLIIKRIVPITHKRPDDSRRTLRMIGPGLACDERHGFHDAHLAVRAMSPRIEKESVEVKIIFNGHIAISFN